MNPVAERLSDERIAEILAATEKATPGPWEATHWPEDEGRSTVGSASEDVVLMTVHDFQRAHGYLPRVENAAHIANCDPDTIHDILTELQHRRAAEVQCCMCGKTGLSTTEGDGGQECELDDGRWVCSGECWDRAVASPSSPATGVRVSKLEWREVTDQIPKHAFAAYTPFSRWLIVCEFLSMNHMVYRFNNTDYDTLDEAQTAAQADYEARIRSALGEQS